MVHNYKSLIAAGSLGLILASGTAFAENQGAEKAAVQVTKPQGLFGSFGVYFNNLAKYIEEVIRDNPELQAKIAEAESKANEQKSQPSPKVTTPVQTVVNRPTAQGPTTQFQSPALRTPTPVVAQRPVVNKPAVTPTTTRPAVTPTRTVPTVAANTGSTGSPWYGSWFQSPTRWWQTQMNNQPAASRQPTLAKQPTPTASVPQLPAMPSQEDEPRIANVPSRAAPTQTPKVVPTVAAKPTPAPAPAPAPAPRQEPQTTVAAAPTPAPAPQQEPTPAPEPAPVTGSASLSWSIPTKRENGEALALNEIASYEIYVTAENAGTSRTIRVDNRNQTKYTLSPLESDTYFFSMVTIDSEGMYSELSQVVSKTIN